MAILMRCGHEVYTYELSKEGGIVYIRYVCTEGHRTAWACVGEAPYADEIEIEG